MTAPLLNTKLYIPPSRPGSIPRQRLIEQLNQGLNRKLTLVSAPAGFGKTTLVGEWIANLKSLDAGKSQIRYRIAWLSLDNNDNDLTRFLSYFITAIKQIEGIHPSFGDKTFNLLQSPRSTPVENLLTPLINEIAEMPDRMIFVFDDYHTIKSKSIGQALTFLLEHLPVNLHIVISTRIDPPLPLAQLRARRQMTELRIAELRFTNDEITELLNHVMNLGLSADDIAALETRTEGWIVGLQLAALSLREKEDKSRFIQSFTGGHHHILDYLVEEVLNQLIPETQLFLLQTSILDRLNGPLCEAVCADNIGPGDGQAMLERLAKANLFIMPMDDERRWYRYHHLFADLLQERLKRYHPELLNKLHLRALDWYFKNEQVDDAVKHAFAGKDYERAADMIEQAASGTLLFGRLTTILGWYDALPRDVLNSRPRLRVYRAWALAMAGQPKAADKILLGVRSSLEKKPESPENLTLRGELAALRTGIIIYHNDPDEIIREGEEAFTYLPENHVISRARVYMALGTAYAYKNNLQKAIETYERGKDLALSVKAPFLASANIELITELLVYYQGHLKDAAGNIAQILALGRAKDGTHQAFTGAAYVLLAEINLEWNNYEAAARYLEKGFELLQLGGIGYTLTHCYCAAARIKLAFGEIDRAVEYLQSANQAAMASPLMHFQIHNLACQVKSTLRLGDIKTAYQWATGIRSEFPEILPQHLHETQQIALARVYLAQGEFAETLDILDGIQHRADSAGRNAHLIDICLLKALAHKASGESNAALEYLEVAIRLAEPEGYIQTFFEYGESMSQLLRETTRSGQSAIHVNKLLSTFDTHSQIRAAELERGGIEIISTPQMMEPLTDRELEVLRLMADGLTYNEIAGQIMVSLNTVRTHIKNIYSKLLVHKRSEAIARAKKLEIL